MKRVFYLPAVMLWFVAPTLTQATTITTGETVTDTSVAGQNIDLDGTLTVDPVTNNDTGAALVNISSGFTRSLGTGVNQVQWQGSGGFIANPANGDLNVNIGGLSSPATLTWGQSGFVPTGSALVLGNVNFENNINLGTDSSATHQIDIASPMLLTGLISGSGNLLIQAYGSGTSARNHILQPVSINNGPAGSINITGTATLSNVEVSGYPISASAIALTRGSVVVDAVGSPDLTMSGTSVFVVSSLTGLSSSPIPQTLKSLNSTDTTSIVGLGGASFTDNDVLISVESAVLTVGNGYYQGMIEDSNDTPGNTTPTAGGSLIKNTTGILTLAGNSNTYTQGTTIQQGTLLAANTSGSATGTGAVKVLSGGSLGGTGIIGPTGTNNINVASGGKIDLSAFDPANAPSSFTNKLTIQLAATNSATFATGSSFVFDLGSGGSSSTLTFTGLTLATPQVFLNNNQVSFDFLTGAGPGEYTLFTFDQAGAYSGILQNGANYSFVYNPTSIEVELAPEPSTFALMMAATALLFGYRLTVPVRRSTAG